MTIDVVVIGAGQAGLAAAGQLVSGGLSVGSELLVLDANDGPGGAWRHRWDSLTLGRAHRVADLPGLPLGEADPNEPASRVVSDYYGRYEQHFGLSVLRPATVSAVRSEDGDDGPLTVYYDHAGQEHSVRARLVISAAGTWTRPFIPRIPGDSSFNGEQLHTADFVDVEHFRGRRTVVVGGGLSAVQFLLQLAPVTETIWATRRPPGFTGRDFNIEWGLDVERAVRKRTEAGLRPVSVVAATGIPMLPDYLEGVESGVLVSRGMFDRITPTGVHFPGMSATPADGEAELKVPESWAPFQDETDVPVDVIFWNTGFRSELRHLAPLQLRAPGGGIQVRNEVEVPADPRVLLVGYGSSASTVGATRAGRRAASTALRRLGRRTN
ncbi:FAD-dependent oxidoreductase [Stomatohabitans albus]|uniref:FAD-dependent oxidoreductase n=1 Tax=Stomatohabitans albus TaxID=3110766 RepID=UPI00300CD0C9